MTDGTDDEETKTQTGDISARDADRATISGTLGFSTENIRDRLEKDEPEYALALVLTSTRLEYILSQAIQLHFSWDSETFESNGYGDFSLGTLLEKCVKYGALKPYEDELNKIRSGEKQVANLRNNLVHEYGYLAEVEDDKGTQKEVKDAIEYALRFIDNVEL